MGLSDLAKAYAARKANAPHLKSALEAAYRAGWWAAVRSEAEQREQERRAEDATNICSTA